MTEQELQKLLTRYSEGKANEQEKSLLENWYLSYNTKDTQAPDIAEMLLAVDQVWANVRPQEALTRRLPVYLRFAVAASVLLMVSVGLYFLLRPSPVSIFELSATKDIPAGKNKATLRLANGKKIILDELTNGEILNESGISVSHTSSGELIYKAMDNAKSTTAYHTLETFKGEQQQLLLPDGTHVWLNAASSIKFPTAFGQTRSVSVSGEVYFEVAHDPSKPFLVSSSGQEVEVLGTHFNINAYSDEPATETTLLEGKVKISTQVAGSSILKPGQQAKQAAGRIELNQISSEEVIAWKNGYFMFESEDIGSIMRKISRWYNVEVSYEGPIPQDRFGGSVDRFANVSQILKKLQLTDKVHFKVEGRRIIVTK